VANGCFLLRLGTPNLGGTFGLGFHPVIAFLSLYWHTPMHIYVYIYNHLTHTNSNLSQQLSLYPFFFAFIAVWYTCYYERNCTVPMMVSLLLFYFSSLTTHTKPHIFTTIYIYRIFFSSSE